MNITDLENLIKGRRSIRSWQNKPVPEEMLLRALELATYAPNAGNQQNWKFIVILKPEKISEVADAVQASADYVATWPEAADFGDTVKNMLNKSSLFRSAPALVVVCASQYQSAVDQMLVIRGKTDPKAMLMHEWRNIANSRIQSAASAIAYFLLAVHQMGLGAVWMTGPLQVKGEIEKVLGISAPVDVVALIPVGYPAEDPALRARKPIADVCEVIK